jgi:uncharacterized iron-regulated membrane protein
MLAAVAEHAQRRLRGGNLRRVTQRCGKAKTGFVAMSISEITLERAARVRAANPERIPTASFYRVVWRWHFYAGVILAPVLIVVAATGALYIFRDEIESIVNAELLYVTPAETRVPYETQLAAAEQAAGEGFKATHLYTYDDPERSTSMFVTDGEHFHSMYVDPYRGSVLGQTSEDGFFAIVLKIHRQLFIGTTGRIVVELMTCWTMVLLITGVYLWWPRKRAQVWGVWLPRIRGGVYRSLRDIHAVAGVYAAAIAMTIACTGLIYTYIWGQGYGYVAVKSGAYAVYTDPPQSKSAADAPRLPMNEVVKIAQEGMPEAELSFLIPKTPTGAHVVFASRPIGPTSDEVMFIDHGTGEVLAHRANWDFPALGWWTTWNYPLHVGSVLGLTTKILWLLVCIGLMVMPITGVWMWWQRRPRGTAGLPRKSEAKAPKWLIAVVCSLGVVLPALGASLLLIVFGEKLVRTLRRPVVAQ